MVQEVGSVWVVLQGAVAERVGHVYFDVPLNCLKLEMASRFLGNQNLGFRREA